MRYLPERSGSRLPVNTKRKDAGADSGSDHSWRLESGGPEALQGCRRIALKGPSHQDRLRACVPIDDPRFCMNFQMGCIETMNRKIESALLTICKIKHRVSINLDEGNLSPPPRGRMNTHVRPLSILSPSFKKSHTKSELVELDVAGPLYNSRVRKLKSVFGSSAVAASRTDCCAQVCLVKSFRPACRYSDGRPGRWILYADLNRSKYGRRRTPRAEHKSESAQN